MGMSRLALALVLAAGCGDNDLVEKQTMHSPSASSSVGGSQVSRSKSFMLVTNVSTEHSQVAKSRSNTLKPALGGQ